MPFDGTPVTNLVIEALREGRARVERGWCQGVWSTPSGDRVCAAVALHGHLQVVIDDAIGILATVIGITPPTVYKVVLWNDAPERTQSDVIALYDRAIELAVAEEMDGRSR